MKGKFLQGVFRPSNPKKYAGDASNIIFRSSWELKAMEFFDNHPDIIYWASEELPIWYVSPKDNLPHRYFSDFLIKKKTKDNKEEIIMIEVKPLAQTKPPMQKANSKKPTLRFLHESLTYAINEAKWNAAKKFCDEKGWKFMIVTEKELGLAK